MTNKFVRITAAPNYLDEVPKKTSFSRQRQ